MSIELTSVALDREAYDLLRRQKRSGESFSQTVKRIAGKSRPLASFAGAWKELPENKLRELVQGRRRLRELDEERFARLFKD